MNFDNSLMNSIVTIALAILGVATLSVILSKNSNTTAVIGAGSQAFSGGLGVALSPITGGSTGAFGSGFGVSTMAPSLTY